MAACSSGSLWADRCMSSALLLALQDRIKDRTGMLEMRAALLAKMGRASDAAEQYKQLLAGNPDHYKWHEGLQAAMGFRVRSQSRVLMGPA